MAVSDEKEGMRFNNASSKLRYRPDFTAMTSQNMLVMKGEAKASATAMTEAANDLISKLSPASCNSIPAVTTNNA